MNKIHSITLILAMVIATVSLSSCNNSETFDPGKMVEGDVLMSYNGVLYKYQKYGEDLRAQFLPQIEDGAELVMLCPFDFTNFKIAYPRKTFGNITSAYFKVGDTIDAKSAALLFSDATGTVIGQYMAGTATVTANDGKYISIEFKNFIVSSPTKQIQIIKGTIKFQVIG